MVFIKKTLISKLIEGSCKEEKGRIAEEYEFVDKNNLFDNL